MTQTFVIEGRLSGMNEIVNACRHNRYAGAKQKKDEQKRAWLAILQAQLRPVTSPVILHFAWLESNRRRDKGNIRSGEKFISDALVQAGIIPGDGWQWVHNITDSYQVDVKRPRVEVTIMEIEEHQ